MWNTGVSRIHILLKSVDQEDPNTGYTLQNENKEGQKERGIAFPLLSAAPQWGWDRMGEEPGPVCWWERQSTTCRPQGATPRGGGAMPWRGGEPRPPRGEPRPMEGGATPRRRGESRPGGVESHAPVGGRATPPVGGSHAPGGGGSHVPGGRSHGASEPPLLTYSILSYLSPRSSDILCVFW